MRERVVRERPTVRAILVPKAEPHSSWVSPSVFTSHGLRFYFYSREEPRVHVHVRGVDGTAKIWLEPVVEVAQNDGLTVKTISLAVRIAEERRDEILKAWQKHFG